MPWREYDFFVYISASRSHQLYVGMTNGLRRRMAEHREHRPGTYTARYRIDRLVWYEHHQYVRNAIAREKELKDWNRQRKIALIEGLNPAWEDLALRWEPEGAVFARNATNATADPSATLRDDKQKSECEEG